MLPYMVTKSETIHHLITFPVGSECDFVIISLVRSLPNSLIDHEPDGGWLRENLGFVTDEHQINVALTRAKRGLCIIGKISQKMFVLYPCIYGLHHSLVST